MLVVWPLEPYRPAGQFPLHVDVVRPRWEPYVPEGHVKHGVFPVALYCPVGHTLFLYHGTPLEDGHVATCRQAE